MSFRIKDKGSIPVGSRETEELVQLKSPGASIFNVSKTAKTENDMESISEMSFSDEDPDEELEKIKSKVYTNKNEAYKDIEEVFLELENDKYFAELADLNSSFKQPSTGLSSLGTKSKLPLRPSALPRDLLTAKSLKNLSDGRKKLDSARNPIDSSYHTKKIMMELKMAKTAREERKKEAVSQKRPHTGSTLRTEMLESVRLESGCTRPTSGVSSAITAHMDEELGKQILTNFTKSYIEDITESSNATPNAADARQLAPGAKKILDEEASKEVNLRDKISKLSPLVMSDDPNLEVSTVSRKSPDGTIKTFTCPQQYTSYEIRVAQAANNDTQDLSSVMAHPMTRQDELIMEVNKSNDFLTRADESAQNFSIGPKRDEERSTFRITYKVPRWPHQVALDKIVGRLYHVKTLILDDGELQSLRDISSLLPSLTLLSAKNCGLKTLDGTLGFPNLQKLIVSDNAIPHAAQCSFLSELQLLDLSGNPIDSFDEFTYLGFLTQLRTIKLYDTKISHDPKFYTEIKKLIPSLREIFPMSHLQSGYFNVENADDDEEALVIEEDLKLLGLGNHGDDSMSDGTLEICNELMRLKPYGIGKISKATKQENNQGKYGGTVDLIDQIATPADIHDYNEDGDEPLFQMTDGEIIDSYRLLLKSPKADIDDAMPDLGSGDGESSIDTL